MHTDRILLTSDLEGAGQSHSAFHALADLLPALAWVHDVTGAVLYYNHGWTEYTGQPAAEAEGVRWTSAVHPDDLRRAGLRWKSSVDPARPYQIRCRIRSANGVYRWFQVQGKPLREATGGPRWIALATDIDDQVRAQAALRASHMEASALANSVPHLIWSLRPDGSAIYFNRGWFSRSYPLSFVLTTSSVFTRFEAVTLMLFPASSAVECHVPLCCNSFATSPVHPV